MSTLIIFKYNFIAKEIANETKNKESEIEKKNKIKLCLKLKLNLIFQWNNEPNIEAVNPPIVLQLISTRHLTNSFTTALCPKHEAKIIFKI